MRKDSNLGPICNAGSKPVMGWYSYSAKGKDIAPSSGGSRVISKGILLPEIILVECEVKGTPP